jgi:hypothetical protein
MKKEIKRREFFNTCVKAGVACCALSYAPSLAGMSVMRQDQKPDPKKLEYCGYTCPANCPLKKGTLENNLELKKKAYEQFEFKKKFGIDFDADKVFCYGCKSAGDKPISLPVKACTVRKCVMEKKIDACIQCDNLQKCDKELWVKFPDFKKAMVELQKKYQS